MKRKFLSAILFPALCITMMISAGCSGSSGSSGGGAVIGPNGQPIFTGNSTPAASTTAPTQNNPAAGFVGTWVHTYDYFGSTYRTTLVLGNDGSAMYYNEEAELGNFSGYWGTSDGGMTITINRSDGIVSTCRIQGATLIETTNEGGYTYEAEYQRQ